MAEKRRAFALGQLTDPITNEAARKLPRSPKGGGFGRAYLGVSSDPLARLPVHSLHAVFQVPGVEAAVDKDGRSHDERDGIPREKCGGDRSPGLESLPPRLHAGRAQATKIFAGRAQAIFPWFL